MLYQEFGGIINVKVSRTTGVCWGLYIMGYYSLNVVHTWPLQDGHNPDLVIAGWKNSELIVLWERKALPRFGVSVDGVKPCNISTTTYFPELLTQEVSESCLFDK